MIDVTLLFVVFLGLGIIGTRKYAQRLLMGKDETPPFTVRRGMRYLHPLAAWLSLARSIDKKPKSAIQLAGLQLPVSVAQTGIMISGTAGSGKSRLIVEFLESKLKHIRPGSGERLVIFDPKNEFVSLIYGLAHPEIPIYILNPFDQRATRWEIAADVNDSARAQTLATTFLPDRANDVNGFFTSNGRAFIRELIYLGMTFAPKHWTLRQILALVRHDVIASTILKLLPQTASMGHRIARPESGADIVSTAFAALEPFSAAIAAMDRAKSSISIQEIRNTECIVILGWDDAIGPSLSSLYGLFLEILINEILMNQDPSQMTTLIIDEKRQLPKSCGHALNRAAYRGRSSGICPLVAFQDWNSLLELYGQAGANELAANFQTKLFLKQGSEEAAQWAAHCLGKPESIWETTNRSYTSSQVDSRTHGYSTHVGDRFLFHPSQLRSLPLANRLKNSIQGYMTTPALKGSIAFQAKFLEIAKRCQPSSDFPNYVRRPADDQVLQPFSAIDADLWNLPPSKELLAAFAAIPMLPSLSNGNPRSLTQGVSP